MDKLKLFAKWFIIIELLDMILTIIMFHAESNPLVKSVGVIWFGFIKIGTIYMIFTAYVLRYYTIKRKAEE